MAFLVHMVDEQCDAPRRENIQKRERLPDALQLAQLMVRERLRNGYRHAEFIDQWTILKRDANVFRIRIEDNLKREKVRTSEPLLWTPHSARVPTQVSP